MEEFRRVQSRADSGDENDTHSSESSLQEVTHSRGAPLRLSIDVMYTRELEKPLRCRGGDDASTSRGRDEAAHDRSNLARDLAGHSVRLTESSTPVASSDGDDGELGEGDCTTNGGSDFLCALDTETDMTIEITDSDEGLEAGTLTGPSLLLDRHDLHNLILELGKEEVDNLVLLDRKREQVDFLH